MHYNMDEIYFTWIFILLFTFCWGSDVISENIFSLFCIEIVLGFAEWGRRCLVHTIPSVTAAELFTFQFSAENIWKNGRKWKLYKFRPHTSTQTPDLTLPAILSKLSWPLISKLTFYANSISIHGWNKNDCRS